VTGIVFERTQEGAGEWPRVGVDFADPFSAPRQLSDRSMHLWRVRVPANLADGLHVVTVSAVDRHGRPSTERMAFEVRANRPAPHWRREPWLG
jgi:hypothetical protein